MYLIFASSETETRAAVVELGHPWKNVTVQRTLPPLKYYYDLEMGRLKILHSKSIHKLFMSIFTVFIYTYPIDYARRCS